MLACCSCLTAALQKTTVLGMFVAPVCAALALFPNHFPQTAGYILGLAVLGVGLSFSSKINKSRTGQSTTGRSSNYM